MAVPLDMNSNKFRGLLAEIAIAAGAPRIEGQAADPLEANPHLEPLVAALRKDLGISDEDDSRSAREKIAAAAAAEAYRLALASIDKPAARSRLGNKGLLRPNEFDVNWESEVDQRRAAYGVRMSQAIDAALAPDEVQHITPEDDNLKTSLYVKTVRPKRGTPSTVLVIATRDGAKITIQCALRAFHDTVDLSQAAEPLDALKAFCNVYCHELTIGSSTLKLIVNTRADYVDSDHVMAKWKNTGPIDLHIQQHHIKDGEFFIALGFGLDVDLIYDDLRRHGVSAPARSGPLRMPDGAVPTYMRVVARPTVKIPD